MNVIWSPNKEAADIFENKFKNIRKRLRNASHLLPCLSEDGCESQPFRKWRKESYVFFIIRYTNALFQRPGAMV